ncbi:cation/H(+) antiporter 15-like [Abrus precatorius]|uniref:Cation/H(+) antiporter 15-like n=1 Tax=Abrus precatorius TaxID=3816 RepID=A0A8B8L4K1_ABRPR|nr:cation/H(+) antiporter 15-like [Abrus precatorius]
MNFSNLEANYTIFVNSEDTVPVCFNRTTLHGSALWLENSIENTLPAFGLQFAIVLALNRILLLVSALYHVPRIVPNILTGFLLGPSVMGRWKAFVRNVFPFGNMVPLETMGTLSLVYYMFLVGLEIDFKPLTRLRNKKAMLIAIVGIIFSIPMGGGLYFMLVTDMGRKNLSHLTEKHVKGSLFWGIILSCSCEFSEMAKILSDLKLLVTENGQLSLTASLTNDLFSWTLCVLALTEFYYTSVLALFITLAVVLVCFFAISPLTKWLFNNVGTGDREFLESQVIFLLHVLLVIGLLTDGLGMHSIVGAFFLGVVIPQGALNNAIQDKVLDFVAMFMMPLFFLAVGERIEIQKLALDTHWITLVMVIVLAFVAKMVCTFTVAWFYQMPFMEGVSLALLMNIKGTMPFIILCTGRDRLELDNQTFGVMLISCWLMTIPVGPILASMRKTITTKKCLGSQRTMQGTQTQPDSPLRVLACIHTKREAYVIINLLKSSCPSVRTPIQVLALELNKMTNCPASSLIIRDARKPSFPSKSSKLDTEDTLSSFDNLNQAIFADKMRIISDYNSMHKDILNLARQRGVTLILTTLYKQPTYDGLGAGVATARAVNIINRDRASKDEKKVVLENLAKEAPCCLAILVDRGLSHKRSKEKHIAMFYVAGEDDREALSYAWRMSRNTEVKLTVVRLVWENPNDEFDETDKEFIKGFVQQTVDMPSVRYLEKVVRDEKETVKLLNKIGNKGFDLYIVGRGHGRKMSLAQTVDPVLEEPVLGPLGDALTDLNSAAETSILIFQRYAEVCDDSSSGEKHARSACANAQAQVFDGMVEQQLLYPPMRYPPMVLNQYA